jgi:hypothetical protein
MRRGASPAAASRAGARGRARRQHHHGQESTTTSSGRQGLQNEAPASSRHRGRVAEGQGPTGRGRVQSGAHGRAHGVGRPWEDAGEAGVPELARGLGDALVRRKSSEANRRRGPPSCSMPLWFARRRDWGRWRAAWVGRERARSPRRSLAGDRGGMVGGRGERRGNGELRISFSFSFSFSF